MKTKKILCPACRGNGEIMVCNTIGKFCRSIDPPMTECPVCGGKGKIWEDEIDDIKNEKG